MAATHTVEQGENLVLIAKKHKISDWREIYNHPENASFREKRPNPNILMPGDEIYIPDVAPKTMNIRTGVMHTFVVKKQKQFVQLKLLAPTGKPLQEAKVEFTANGTNQTVFTDRSGQLEIEIESAEHGDIPLAVFTSSDSEEADYQYTLQPGYLDPPETLSGLQARLNNLGFQCGVVDGILGEKTKAGIKQFQRYKMLSVDGQPSTKIHKEVEKEYGC